MDIEEEGETRCELIDLQTASERCLDVCQPIGDSKCQFLYSRCPGLTDVIATDTDRVPAWHITCTELDRIYDQTHRRFWRKEKLFLCNIFLENIILQRATQFC